MLLAEARREGRHSRGDRRVSIQGSSSRGATEQMVIHPLACSLSHRREESPSQPGDDPLIRRN